MSASNKPELVQNSIEPMGDRAGHVAVFRHSDYNHTEK